MSPMTVTERILSRASGEHNLRPGTEVWAPVDLAVMNDSSGPRRMAATVKQLGDRLWNPDKVVVVSDHFIPAATLRHADILTKTRHWAQKHEIKHFYEYDGILHNLLLEKRIIQPGMLMVGADSHTGTAGAAGAVAIPIGSNELGTVLTTGEVWLRVPESVCIRLEGSLPPGVMARDIDFRILGEVGSDFANYRAIEFAGSALSTLSVEERSTLTNAGIEMGAKNTIVPWDAITEAWFEKDSMDSSSRDWLKHDPNATFAETRTFDISALDPQVALPHRVDSIASVKQVSGTPLTAAHIGSCVGAKLSDLQAAANVVRGNTTRIPLIVTPATRAGYNEAIRDGTAEALATAGAILQAPGCGPCAGVHMGILGHSERIIASVTRNFRGRMGSRDSEIYLGSPRTVAASAIEGRIADPRHYVS